MTAPFALVRADRGFVTEADLDEFRTRVPGAQITRVPTGHNVQEEAPLLLADILRTRMDAGSAS